METCLNDQSGQLPGKMIVFAMTKKHAHRIAEVFEEMYPQHVGVAQVITSTTERVRDGSYGDGLITKFKKNNRKRQANPSVHTGDPVLKWKDERRQGGKTAAAAEPGGGRAVGGRVRSRRDEPGGVLREAWPGFVDSGAVPEAAEAGAG
jgi:hypothetical protein